MFDANKDGKLQLSEMAKCGQIIFHFTVIKITRRVKTIIIHLPNHHYNVEVDQTHHQFARVVIMVLIIIVSAIIQLIQLQAHP